MTEQKIAKALLSIEAVFLKPDDPFTWASGIKSPIYCDNRLILTAPEVRDGVETAIAQTVEEEYPGAEVLMGTATAGIAHAAIAAHILGLPMGYVRSGAKDHGRKNQIEGRLEKGGPNVCQIRVTGHPRLERLGDGERAYDVDALLLYGDDDDVAAVARAVRELTEQGKRVTAQKCIPEKLRYREMIRV